MIRSALSLFNALALLVLLVVLGLFVYVHHPARTPKIDLPATHPSAAPPKNALNLQIPDFQSGRLTRQATTVTALHRSADLAQAALDSWAGQGKKAGFWSSAPPEVFVTGSVAYLNLGSGSQVTALPSPQEQLLLICSAVRTLFGLPTSLSKVWILVGGRSAGYLGAVDLRRPFTSSSCSGL